MLAGEGPPRRICARNSDRRRGRDTTTIRRAGPARPLQSVQPRGNRAVNATSRNTRRPAPSAAPARTTHWRSPTSHHHVIHRHLPSPTGLQHRPVCHPPPHRSMTPRRREQPRGIGAAWTARVVSGIGSWFAGVPIAAGSRCGCGDWPSLDRRAALAFTSVPGAAGRWRGRHRSSDKLVLVTRIGRVGLSGCAALKARWPILVGAL